MSTERDQRQGGTMHWKLPTLLFAVALAAASAGWAQSGGSLEIRKSTIDGGGGEVASPPLRLVGTVGQHDAQFSSGGTLAVRGGFWGAPRAAADGIFSNGFE